MTAIYSVFQTMILSFIPFAPQEFNTSLLKEGAFQAKVCFENETFYHKDDKSLAFAAPIPPTSKDSSINKTANIQKESDKNEYLLKTIVIDAGHGGHDPGCSGSGSREKHLALGIAKKLSAYLKDRFPDLNIMMTRDKDVFIPLYERAKIANRANADLFISIHCNYFPSSNKVRGTETYVMGLHTAEHNLEVAKRENAAILFEVDYEKNYDYDPNSTEGHIMLSMFQNAYLDQSILFAEIVEQSFAKRAERRSRGVRQAGFVVLKETAMPSVLIESGYLSNYKEEQYLKSSAGQMRIAVAIGKAFEDYKKLVENQIDAEDFSPEIPIIADQKKPEEPPKEVPVVNIQTNNNPMQGNLIAVDEQKESASTKLGEVPPQVVKVIEQENPVKSTDSQPKTPEFKPDLSSGTTSPTASKGSNPTTKTEEETGTKETYQFFVQLAAATRPIDTKKGVWKMINYQVEVVIEGRLLKYRARTADNLEKAIEDRDHLRQLGFPDAFLVVYKNGEKIPIEQVR